MPIFFQQLLMGFDYPSKSLASSSCLSGAELWGIASGLQDPCIARGTVLSHNRIALPYTLTGLCSYANMRHILASWLHSSNPTIAGIALSKTMLFLCFQNSHIPICHKAFHINFIQIKGRHCMCACSVQPKNMH